MYNNKTVFIHHGALGDRALAWPLLHAFVGQGQALGPGAERFFWGREHNGAWQRALGYSPCPPALARALEGLYAGSCAPALTATRFVWLCVDAPPFAVPSCAASCGLDICFLFSAPPGGTTHAASALLQQAMGAGLISRKDARALIAAALTQWRELFGGPLAVPLAAAVDRQAGASAPILLLPGAGKQDKQWPLVHFLALAKALRSLGHTVAWVLGPAEEDRGLSLPEGETAERPQSLDELSALLCDARLVAGNDSGPVHLAALHGVPTLAIFGPTDPRVWRPLGGDVAVPEGTGAGWSSVEQVLEAVLRGLER